MFKKFKLFEAKVTNKTIINVDIQQEYKKSFSSKFIYNWIEFLNDSDGENMIVFLYNGKDTVGTMSKVEYVDWLMEYGLNEDILYNAVFYDKGYAFFRYCMDEGVDEDSIVEFVKYMYNHNINDSREIDEDMWNDFMEETGSDKSEVRDLMEFADDCVTIPDLMDELKKYKNIVLTGGGLNECLKEVEIALKALGKSYEILSEYTFE